jgi:nitroreductase
MFPILRCYSFFVQALINQFPSAAGYNRQKRSVKINRQGVPVYREWFMNAAKSLYDWSPDANLAFAVKNTGFFAMSLMYAATNLGLESHPMDGFDHEGVRKAFNIPENYWIPVLLAVGYRKPGLELTAARWRKTKEEIFVSFANK